MKVFQANKIRKLSLIVMSLLTICVTTFYYFSLNSTVAVSSAVVQPIRNGNRNTNKVALMFNCYENVEIVKQISDTLKEYGFHATFFLGGCFIDDNIELIKYLVEGGHELGNHGYFHKEHSKLSFSQNLLEIENCHNIVKAHTGIEMNLFAPPSGDYNKTTVEVCKKNGYKVILWSLDTIDWRDKSEKIVYNRATQKITGGDFVLMHPKLHTLKALPDILNFYLQKGLVVTTVSQCMENNGQS